MTVVDLFPAPATRTTAPARLRHRGSPPTVTLRELGPGETDVLDAVFAGLSPHSRSLRFHGATPRMTGAVRLGSSIRRRYDPPEMSAKWRR